MLKSLNQLRIKRVCVYIYIYKSLLLIPDEHNTFKLDSHVYSYIFKMYIDDVNFQYYDF